MSRRLYLQIWAAFLLIVAVAVGVVGVTGRVLLREHHFPRQARAIAAYVAHDLPPPDAPPPELERALDEMGRRFDVQLTVLDAEGALLASTGRPLPPPRIPGPDVQWLPGVGAAARLPDGRWLLGAFEDPDRGPIHLLVAATVTFGTMALGCYPLARRITRRLEGVRHAAESFGAGRLSARAPVEGKDEVADLARSFNAAAEHVERLVDGQRAALASASHELRSPLARVRMAVALLDDDDPERHRIATEAERDIAELDALIGDLLLASRLDGRPLEATERVDLLALVAEEAARIGEVDVSGPSVTVRGDARTLRRLVRNLLENARRYGGAGITATLAAPPGTARLDVADRGPGVPEADRERIFEPFYRPASHREAEGGVGLGLSLVRTIATAHGGTVRYQPREGGGSVFRLEMPMAT